MALTVRLPGGALCWRRIHPFPSQLSQLTQNLETLQKKGFISTDTYMRVLDDTWDSHQAETLYSFGHSILEDMVYHLMSLAQRQELHRAAARYYEAAHSRMQQVNA